MITPWPSPDDGSLSRRPARRPQSRTTPDHLLADRVMERLARDERTRMQSIAVEVQNGVAILTGKVGAAELTFIAGDLAWQTLGIVHVCNALEPFDPEDLAGS